VLNNGVKEVYNMNYSKVTKWVIAAGMFCSAGAFAWGGFGGADGGGSSSQYASSGEYSVTSNISGSCTIYRPANMSGDHPVILWGNGTGAPTTTYSGLLRHWASWGFVVAAANTTNAGSGREMLSCLDYVTQSVVQANTGKVGTSGHSQGGGGSIMAATDSRITTAAPIEGYTLGLGHNRSSWTRQNGTMLILSGSADTLVNPALNHRGLFNEMDTAFWATLSGASHMEPIGDGGGFKGISTAWFMYQLKGDSAAAAMFEGDSCGYCGTSTWSVQKKGL